MQTSTKERILAAINTVAPLSDYESNALLYSDKYMISSPDISHNKVLLSEISLPFSLLQCNLFLRGVTFSLGNLHTDIITG